MPGQHGIEKMNKLSQNISMSSSCGINWIAMSVILLILGACEASHKPEGQSEVAGDAFHADNDIAMTVASIADALSVGEPLDSVQYDFEGVLTDGQGAPLYTDVQGSPGEWQVDVLNPDMVVIRNVYLGDLMPDNLLEYLVSTLELTDSDRLDPKDFPAGENDDNLDMKLYRFPGGTLRFESRNAMAANGLEGPFVSIIITSDRKL